MSIIELSDYCLPPYGLGSGLKSCFFKAEKSQVWKIESDNINDAHLFLRGLASLSYPDRGSYLFSGVKLDFSDYRKLLVAKKKIGYLASETTLISNRTIRENLSLHKVYFDNNLSPEFNKRTQKMCNLFEISKVLDVRPGNLKMPDIKKTILVRELLKKPEIILLEYPEEFSGYNSMEALVATLKNLIHSGSTMVYLSHNNDFIKAFFHKKISITKGTLKTISG